MTSCFITAVLIGRNARLARLSVRPSVRPSVTLMYRGSVLHYLESKYTIDDRFVCGLATALSNDSLKFSGIILENAKLSTIHWK